MPKLRITEGELHGLNEILTGAGGNIMIGDAAGPHIAIDDDMLRVNAGGNIMIGDAAGPHIAIDDDMLRVNAGGNITIGDAAGPHIAIDDDMLRVNGGGNIMIGDAAGPHITIDDDMLRVNGGGNIGINADNPEVSLHVDGGSGFSPNIPGSGYVIIGDASNQHMVLDDNEIVARELIGGSLGDRDLFLNDAGSTFVVVPKLLIQGEVTDGNATIEVEGPDLHLNPDASLGGFVVVPKLEITGGADLAEPFDFHDDTGVEPGMAVAIDRERPGLLRVADSAYDRRVAGIVSGANGVHAGLTLAQGRLNRQRSPSRRIDGACLCLGGRLARQYRTRRYADHLRHRRPPHESRRLCARAGRCSRQGDDPSGNRQGTCPRAGQSAVNARGESGANRWRCGMRDAGCGMRDADAGCGMRDAGCGMRDAGCGMRDAGCGMRDAGCGMRDAARCLD